jgi:hypothetical protein
LHSSDDLTVRWKWEPGSVAFWDNRVVIHRAVPGGYNTEEREGKRTAVFGEKPFLDNAVNDVVNGAVNGAVKGTANGIANGDE